MATITGSLSEDYVIPDEVWIEILLRLPLPSLYLFKSVSKHWLSLITSPYFNRRLRKPRIDSPCGLFIRKRDSEYYDFVTLGPKVTSFQLRGTVPACSHFHIMHSCHGLLFLRHYVSYKAYYHVYNPFTKLFKNIPPPPRKSHDNDIILAFDPTKSPYYKLVSLRYKRIAESSYRRIQIYSSETGEWRKCGPLYPADRLESFDRGLYWNNAIHWLSLSDNLHLKFDIVDYPMVTNIPTPPLDNVEYYRDNKLFESRGSLFLLMKSTSTSRRQKSPFIIYANHYHVFEIREESSEWSVKYIFDDLDNIVPWGRIQSCFLCIVLGERGDDSFMVIESRNKIVRYNFVSKTVSTLCNFIPSYLSWSRFPFIASLAGV